jgi:uncharacterized phiE125 gp8 family phage protein
VAQQEFITLAEAKAWLGIKDTDTSQDAIVEPLIRSVSESIERYVEVKFEETEVENEIHDGRRQDVLIPKGYPLVSVEAVLVNVSSDGSGGTVVDPSLYVVEDECITLRLHLPQGRGLVRVDYTHGYADVPERVKMATRIGVEAYYRQRDRKTVGVTSKSKEGESVNYQKGWDTKAGLPMESIGLLADFRQLEWPTTTMATRNV